MSQEVGKLYVKFDADGRPYIQGLKDIDRRTQQFARDQQTAFDKLGSKLGSAIKIGMAAGAAAVAAGGVLIAKNLVKTAATYEYEMSRIKAVTKATEAEMATMSDVALKLGKDTVFSAGEAAQGMNELAKAGVSVADILGGGIAGTLSLAAAGELEVAAAAEIASNAMNIFGLTGKDVSMVADTLAAAANASSLEVSDLAYSMKYAGPIAQSLGIPFQQLAAILAELGNQGIRGEQAGAGLASMLQALTAPTDAATRQLEQYGIAIYDAESNMRSMPDILGDMNAALNNLDDESRMTFVQAVFGKGSDSAIALKLIEGGSEALEEMTKTVSKQGEAARVSAEKMDNFQGSVEELRGSLETLAIKLGTPLMEAIRPFIDALSDGLDWASDFYDGLQEIAGWEGADITGKIKIAWDELNRQFNEWLDGLGADQLQNFGFKFGKSIVDGLETLISVSADGAGKDSPWRKAGAAIWTGMAAGVEDGWSSIEIKLWEELEGFDWGKLASMFWDAIFRRNKTEPKQQLDIGSDVPGTVNLTGKIIRWLMPEKEDLEKAAEEARMAMLESDITGVGTIQSKDWRDAYLGGLSIVPGAMETIVREADMAAEGSTSGAAFKSGFLSALSDINTLTLIQEKFDIKAAAYAKGKATAGGLGLELGSRMGDTGGMKPQTIALLGRLGAMFPINMISGYRANDQFKDHPSGTAFDITWPGMGVGMGDAIARAAIAMGARYAIWDRETWWPGGGRTPYSYSSQDPHRDHIHIRTYHQGGKVAGQGGPPDVLINAQSGERVLSLEQSRLFETFVREIGVLADETREANKEQEEFNQAFLSALSERLDALNGYVSRESVRYSMQQAEFGPGGFDASEMAAMVRTLTYEIEHLDMAVAEAEAQLNEAKWMKLPQAEINALAEGLFNLRTEAADARRELEELERIPLEQTLAHWGNAVDNLTSLMGVLSNHSQSTALQLALLPQLLGGLGASYQANLDLMNSATTPDDIMGYGGAALSDLNSMFSSEQSALQRSLDDTLDSISDSQDLWEDAWQDRYDALRDSVDAQIDALQEQADDQREALRKQLEDLDDAHRDELDALNKFYDDKLRTLEDREREITRAQQRNAAVKSLGGLEDQLRILQGQGYYTEADIARMRELETQIQEQRDAMQQQEDAWAREDEVRRLRDERDVAIKSLEQQQEMERIALEDQIQAAEERLEAQIEAQRKALEAQLKAMEEEREAQLKAFEQQREDARAAYQAELDAIVEKYAALMQEVMNAQAALLGESGQYQNAGYTLGLSFAQGILDAIPAIEAAAKAAAAAAAAYLELNSPADKGPLSTLDRWWEKFAPTLYQPLVAQDFMRPVMDTYGPSQGPTVTEEHIYLHTDPGANIDVDTLCDLVSRKIGRRVEKAQWGA